MFAKVTSLNPDDPSDMDTLREVLAELKAGNNATSKWLAKENADLKTQS